MSKTIRREPTKWLDYKIPTYRRNKISQHHLVPRCRGGKTTPENILNIWRHRHDVWHFLFGNLTIDETIELLKRVKRLKEREGNGKLHNHLLPNLPESESSRRVEAPHSP